MVLKLFTTQKMTRGFEIDDKNTIAIVRGSITQKDSWQDLLSQLEKAGVSCINNRTCVNLCADKYRSYLRLADYGLVQPRYSFNTN